MSVNQPNWKKRIFFIDLTITEKSLSLVVAEARMARVNVLKSADFEHVRKSENDI